MYILGLNKTHNEKVKDVKQIRNLPNDLDILKVDTLDVNKESNDILGDGKLFLFECFIINQSSCFSGAIMVVIVWIYALSVYHHLRCEFESPSGEVNSIQYYVIKFVSDLRQVCGFLRVL